MRTPRHELPDFEKGWLDAELDREFSFEADPCAVGDSLPEQLPPDVSLAGLAEYRRGYAAFWHGHERRV